MMTRLQSYLVLQVVYLLAAIGYNLCGIWLQSATGRGLYEGSAYVTNILSLLVLVPVLLLGYARQYRGYALGNTALMLLLVYGGVLPHLMRYMEDSLLGYRSFGTWSAAIAINGFGVVIGLLGSYAAWQQASKANTSSN
ncbi:hypothetical protein G8770_22235 [Aestuariicella hydrocarbonica]|uniref:Uncharacterized protein n=1 Tax=Pseudomaricurvus hydrocarbonicus TaxID=1470433 RepID=A0A9E5MQ29_9GAMM|nr:hypothetical protein [Aestuariicella hydrocarbonica]NHO68279.1 hypothetical protein [Aestuariicella hydrocarbonica]